VLEQGPRRRRGGRAGDERRREDRPPQLVVRRLVDQDVVLAGEEPCQRAGRELVAALAEQVGRGAARHEVELQLLMAMAARRPVGRHVARDATLDARSQPETHRKER
jgi:hypothetical protein